MMFHVMIDMADAQLGTAIRLWAFLEGVGAAGFAGLWRQLPQWRWAPLVRVLEGAYRVFLRARTRVISQVIQAVQRFSGLHP